MYTCKDIPNCSYIFMYSICILGWVKKLMLFFSLCTRKNYGKGALYSNKGVSAFYLKISSFFNPP